MLKGFSVFVGLLFITISGFVFATHLNHDRHGQVVLLPYYTVNNNFITNFTVTNTSDLYKVVRVRLLDSRISADLLNINLYLSPYDVWNATLRMNPETGLPNLITEDESCTYPPKSQFQAGQDLQNIYAVTTNEDLTQGYLEIIEIGDIADGEGPAPDGGVEAEIDIEGIADGIVNLTAGDRSIPQGLLQGSDGQPADCTVVSDAWTAGEQDASAINGFEPGSMGANGTAQDSGDSAAPYSDSHNAGLVAPSGDISAYGIMINVVSGAAFVQEGVHIDNYTSVAQHYRPDDPVHYRLPSLASGNIQEAYITNAQGDGKKGITMPLTEYDTGALHDISPLPSVPMGSNPLPIAAILSADTVSAPYFVTENVNGMTDMVLTFPLLKHGLYNGRSLSNRLDSNQAACVGELDDGIDDGQTVTIDSLGAQVQDYPHDGAGHHCSNAGFEPYQDYDPRVTSTIDYYNYENRAAEIYDRDSDFGVTPIGIELVHYYRGVNVRGVDRRREYPFLGAVLTDANYLEFMLDVGFEAGWMAIAFSDQTYNYNTNPEISLMTEVTGGLGTTDEPVWSGVPVIGFSAMGSDLQSHQLGEVVEFIRSVAR
jgi:hypothetical protein